MQTATPDDDRNLDEKVFEELISNRRPTRVFVNYDQKQEVVRWRVEGPRVIPSCSPATEMPVPEWTINHTPEEKMRRALEQMRSTHPLIISNVEEEIHIDVTDRDMKSDNIEPQRLLLVVLLTWAIWFLVMGTGCASRAQTTPPADNILDLVEQQRDATQRVHEAESLQEARAANVEALRLANIIADRITSMWASITFLHDTAHDGDD